MAYTEKITWRVGSLTLAREEGPTKVADAECDGMEHDELAKKVFP